MTYCNVLCLGDPEVVGDSVGPLVGSMLKQRGVQAANIVGDLANPVNRANYHDRINELEADIPTIVVDAHLAKKAPLFYYSFLKGATVPGILHGGFEPIGDFAMRCWTAREPLDLLTVEEAVVQRLARDMTTALLDLINNQQLKEYI
ncbi:hypothetical protein D3C75_158580 [compost metagenome]